MKISFIVPSWHYYSDPFKHQPFWEIYYATNLKKQGVLPLIFAEESSWDLLRVDDRLTIKGTDELGPNSQITVEAKHSDGTMDSFVCNHSMDELQVEWFKSGSALNYLRSQN